jgi:hypothetical protein
LAAIFFVAPQPATVKPRTASNASTRIAFTTSTYTPLKRHSGTLAQARVVGEL